jgi:phosphatidylinositol alpha-mannosyltransferase
MIIAFVLDDTLDRPDGVQQYILALGKWLTARGHEVHYLVTETHRTDIAHVHALGGYVKTTFNGNGVRTPRPVPTRRIRAVLSEIKPDVLHVQMPYSPFFAARVIMAAAPSTLIVGTFHILPATSWHKLANRLLAVALKSSQQRIQAVTAVSAPAAEFARAVYGLSARVIPPPVNLVDAPDKPQVGVPESSTVKVVFLGRLVARKGALQLIRAFQSLPSMSRRKAQLIIGGDGSLMTKAIRLAGNDTDISFVGFVSESSKRAFLEAADIAVFPSTGGESFGIILIEAMSCGAGIVLGGRNPGYASVLGTGTNSLVDPDDTVAFSRQLDYYITHPAERKRLHKLQAILVRQFDINHIGPEIESLYTIEMPDNDQNIRP